MLSGNIATSCVMIKQLSAKNWGRVGCDLRTCLGPGTSLERGSSFSCFVVSPGTAAGAINSASILTNLEL